VQRDWGKRLGGVVIWTRDHHKKISMFKRIFFYKTSIRSCFPLPCQSLVSVKICQTLVFSEEELVYGKPKHRVMYNSGIPCGYLCAKLTWKKGSVMMSFMNFCKKYASFILLVFAFCIHVSLFWPGQMGRDSIEQYQEAVAGVYSDHHPPLMAVLWRLLDSLYAGSGLLFFFHMILLYGASFVFMMSLYGMLVRWYYLVFPLLPPLAIYAPVLWKDVGFAFSYLAAMALISCSIMRARTPGFFITTLIMLLLFYGTGVKFQGVFLLPIVLLGLSYALNYRRLDGKTVVLTVGIYLLFLQDLQHLIIFLFHRHKNLILGNWLSCMI
jgi:hypothetical protein